MHPDEKPDDLVAREIQDSLAMKWLGINWCVKISYVKNLRMYRKKLKLFPREMAWLECTLDQLKQIVTAYEDAIALGRAALNSHQAFDRTFEQFSYHG